MHLSFIRWTQYDFLLYSQTRKMGYLPTSSSSSWWSYSILILNFHEQTMMMMIVSFESEIRYFSLSFVDTEKPRKNNRWICFFQITVNVWNFLLNHYDYNKWHRARIFRGNIFLLINWNFIFVSKKKNLTITLTCAKKKIHGNNNSYNHYINGLWEFSSSSR